MNNKTTISQLRNSKTAVKRAKLEHKENMNSNTYSSMRELVKNQIGNTSDLKMNLTFNKE